MKNIKYTALAVIVISIFAQAALAGTTSRTTDKNTQSQYVSIDKEYQNTLDTSMLQPTATNEELELQKKMTTMNQTFSINSAMQQKQSDAAKSITQSIK